MPIPTKFGSMNNGGGRLFMGEPTVIINGKMAGRFGDMVTPHPYLHPSNPIVTASNSILVGGKKLGYFSCLDACRHNMIPTESDVIIGS